MIRSLFKKNSFHAILILTIVISVVSNVVKIKKSPEPVQKISSDVKSLFVDSQYIRSPWQKNIIDWSKVFSPEIFSGYTDDSLNFTYSAEHSWKYESEVPVEFSTGDLASFELKNNYKLIQDVVPLSEVLTTAYQPFPMAAGKYSETKSTLSKNGTYLIRKLDSQQVNFLPYFDLGDLAARTANVTAFTRIEVSDLSGFMPRVKVRQSCGDGKLDLFFLSQLRQYLQNSTNRENWISQFPEQEKSIIDVIWNLK